MKYIDAERLIAEINKKWRELADKNVKVGGGKYDIEISTYLSIINLITSLQQEQSIDSGILYDKLVDFLVWNDISEDKAKFLANRIADIYGSQRYIDGLCDGLKQEQSEACKGWVASNRQNRIVMTQIKKQRTLKGCRDCWHNYHCPMPQEGYDYNPDTCPYNPINTICNFLEEKLK